MTRAASGIEPSGADVAVLLVIFNRPETTRAAVESIRLVQPRRLYVAADGPRNDVKGEAGLCEQARQVSTSVEWQCQLQTNFRTGNIGLAAHVRSAIDWFFENEDEGVILEDDCLPHPSFFRFCHELLEHYRNVPAVMHISGDNFQYGRRRGEASYYFSKYAFVWGWATWRRAWHFYDTASISPAEGSGAWSNQWVRTISERGGVAIVPNVNLVKNIGFGDGATHTKEPARYAMLPTQAMEFPLRHPSRVEVDRGADRFALYVHFKNVRHIRLMWLYVLQDSIVGAAKWLKKNLWRLAGIKPTQSRVG